MGSCARWVYQWDLTLSDLERSNSRYLMVRLLLSERSLIWQVLISCANEIQICHSIWPWVTLKDQTPGRLWSCITVSVVVPAAAIKQTSWSMDLVLNLYTVWRPPAYKTIGNLSMQVSVCFKFQVLYALASLWISRCLHDCTTSIYVCVFPFLRINIAGLIAFCPAVDLANSTSVYHCLHSAWLDLYNNNFVMFIVTLYSLESVFFRSFYHVYSVLHLTCLTVARNTCLPKQFPFTTVSSCNFALLGFCIFCLALFALTFVTITYHHMHILTLLLLHVIDIKKNDVDFFNKNLHNIQDYL